MEHAPRGLEEAWRHVRRKRIFYIVLGIWIALSLMCFAIDMTDDSTSLWFYWPMLGTGTGVAISGTVLLGIGALFGLTGNAGKSTHISTAAAIGQNRSERPCLNQATGPAAHDAR
jgi:2TM domain